MKTNHISLPIAQIEFLGQVLYIVEHEGRLVAACTDEDGMPFEALAAERIDSAACRQLMREAIDLLLDAAEASFALTAYSAGTQRNGECRRANAQGPRCKTKDPGRPATIQNSKSKIDNRPTEQPQFSSNT